MGVDLKVPDHWPFFVLLNMMYSITSMAQTLMARLPRLFQTRS